MGSQSSKNEQKEQPIKLPPECWSPNSIKNNNKYNESFSTSQNTQNEENSIKTLSIKEQLWITILVLTIFSFLVILVLPGSFSYEILMEDYKRKKNFFIMNIWNIFMLVFIFIILIY